MIELKIESGIELENVADMMSKFVRDKCSQTETCITERN